MNNKKYLSKIIAKDQSGINVISACCSEAKAKVEDIKFLKKNKIFLLPIERINKEKNNKEKIISICKFEFVDKVKSKNINQSDKNSLKNLERDLKNFVFGQDKAIEELSSSIKLSSPNFVASCKRFSCMFL